MSTGILTVSAAVVFWPAAPVFLLRRGKDITINRGIAFEVFTDANHAMGSAAVAVGDGPPASAPKAPLTMAALASGSKATISVTSSVAAAEIEVDGAFVGNAPTTVQLAPGAHLILVKHGAKTWQRTLQVNAGSTVTLNAALQ